MTLKIESHLYTPGYGAQNPNEQTIHRPTANIPDRIVLFSAEVPAYVKANIREQAELQELTATHSSPAQTKTK